jgi:hypothetical protein
MKNFTQQIRIFNSQQRTTFTLGGKPVVARDVLMYQGLKQIVLKKFPMVHCPQVWFTSNFTQHSIKYLYVIGAN